MGRINLTPLRVRKRALANLQTNRTNIKPVWLDVIADVPPAQILTRKQPQLQPLTQIRTRTLPNGKTEQYATSPSLKAPKSVKSARLFAPVQIKYEEDELRHQFFSDHPWELARPRVVVETTGNQYKSADWSKGLLQPGIPLSGESLVQRQLWILNNIPDITIEQSYDMARQEFYTLRRQEETRRRVSKEEAMQLGAQPERGALAWSMEIENKQYEDWEKWSRQQVSEAMQRNAAFSGDTAPADQTALAQTHNNRVRADNDRVGPSFRGSGRVAGDNASRSIGKSAIRN